jgi:hypothetical protein
MEIKIKKLTDKFELANQYPGQACPQNCYIALDTETGEMSAESNPEIGNAVPMRVWHGIIRRYSIPILIADVANDLMGEIAPLAKRVCEGTETIWDGSNHIARMNDDAVAAEEEIEQAISDVNADEDTGISFYDASDWLDAIKSETEGKTDKQLAEMAEEYEAEAKSQNTVLNGDVLEILNGWRNEARENN